MTKEKITICEKCLSNLKKYQDKKEPILENAEPNDICIWCLAPNQPLINSVFVIKDWKYKKRVPAIFVDTKQSQVN